MKPKLILLASIFITAAVLAVISGLTTTVLANQTTKQNTTQASAPTPDVQAYQQREAQYNQLIQQANQQLEKANTEVQSLQNQVAQLKQAASDSSVKVSITAQQAEDIARQVADNSLPTAKTPDLVDFQGKTAYEVVYDKGSIYVDAQSGAVLFNGTVPHEITAQDAQKIATDFMKRTDVIQVDVVTLNKKPLFRVIFRAGHMVYIDKTGQIVYVQMAPAVNIQAQGSNHEGSASSSGGSHENDD